MVMAGLLAGCGSTSESSTSRSRSAKPYLGVALNSAKGGARVSSPVLRSPAAQAGIRPGDLITAIDGKSVASTDDFIASVDRHAPGDTITLTIKRAGQTKRLKVTVGARP